MSLKQSSAPNIVSCRHLTLNPLSKRHPPTDNSQLILSSLLLPVREARPAEEHQAGGCGDRQDGRLGGPHQIEGTAQQELQQV